MPSPVADEHPSAAPAAATAAAWLAGREQIDLREHEELRPLREAAAVQRQLAVDRVVAAGDLAGVRAGLDQVDQQARPLEVGEELVAEADARARPLQQAGDVGDRHLAAVVGLDRAEHRLDGRERVVGDLRPGVRDPAQERRLAGVGEPEQRRVGHELEPQLEPHLIAGLAHLGRLGRPAAGRRVVAVARAARAAPRHGDARARVGQVGDQLVGVADPHLRADRHHQLDPISAAAGLARALAVRAPLRAEVRRLPEPRQVAQVGVGDQHRRRRRRRRHRRRARPWARTSRAGS